MPSAVGPFSFSVALARAAITSKASSHVTGVSSPSFVEDAALLAQQRRGQAVAAIHDLGKEISLDAVQSAIDLGERVAVGGDDLARLDADHHPASGAAEAAGRLRPFDLQRSDAACAPAARSRERSCRRLPRRRRRPAPSTIRVARVTCSSLRYRRAARPARTPCWPTGRLARMRSQRDGRREFRSLPLP